MMEDRVRCVVSILNTHQNSTAIYKRPSIGCMRPIIVEVRSAAETNSSEDHDTFSDTLQEPTIDTNVSIVNHGLYIVVMVYIPVTKLILIYVRA